MPLSLMSAPAIAQDPTPPLPTALAPATPAPTAPPSAPATPTGKALAQAKKDNRRIEIESLRSERATYYANPDGKTLRMEQYLEPIRVKNAGGDGFTPVDTTLVETDGIIKPKATEGDLTLSAGGNTEAIKSKSGDIAAQIDAPRTLPKPTLNGSNATYPSVYGKGVDLVVTATATGFRQQIVIRERPAGPVTFRVPVDLPKGISFTKNAKGQPTLKSDNGKHSLDIRPAALLDAAAADTNADLGAVRIGRAQVSLDGSTLVYSPAPAFLADPATTYPVTMAAVDDDWYECTLGGAPCPAGDPMDTYINDVDLTDSWDMHYRDQMWVGKSYSSNIAKRWRAYIQFPLPGASDPFWGSEIQNADLELWNYLSNDCGEFVGSGITARRVTSDWDQLTLRWSAQPSVTNVGADNEPGAYSTDCSGSMNYEHDLIHSVNTIVQDWADGETNYGFQLTAGNESELRNWRRYRTREQTNGYPAHGPRLTVDFEPVEEVESVRIVSSSLKDYQRPLTYEEALNMQDYQVPAVEQEPVSQGQMKVIGDQPNEGYEVGNEKLPDVSAIDIPGGEGEEDNTVPSVVSTQPSASAIDVPLASQVKATFSEEMGQAPLTVKDSSGTPIEGSVELDEFRTTVTFSPRQRLKENTPYTVELSGAQDLWDNLLPSYSWSFMTEKKSVAHWKFDEGTGKTALNSAGGGHSASLTGSTSWISGRSGQAVSNVTGALARSQAMQLAMHGGRQVEVPSETTDSSITFALPDGTYRTEIATGPVRTLKKGTWVPIDLTLMEQDGVLKPKAIDSKVEVEVSKGGSTAFVKMITGNQNYVLSWPTTLPKPIVKANIATYTNAVGPGADLVVTVLPTGFRHDILLRTPPISPIEIRIGVATGDATLSQDKQGRLLLTSKVKKKVIALAPQPLMWDGSAKGRLPLAKHAVVDTDVVTEGGRTELVLKPDHKFLIAPGTTYPVRVDPTVALPFNNDIEVNSDSDADRPADPTGPFLLAGTHTGGYKYRVHLKFDTASLSSSTVTDAKLSMNTIDAQNCGPAVGAGVQVARLTSTWDSENVYWGNKPSFTTEDASINTKGVNQNCSTWPDAMEWNVTGIAQDWAAGASNHGLVLKSPGEANANNYRVFTSSEDTEFNVPPKLVVTSSGPTSSPTVTSLAITPAEVVEGATVTSSLTPHLAAAVADIAAGNLTGQFEIEHDPVVPGQGTGQIWTGTSGPVVSGGQAISAVPAGKLIDGWKIRWRARAANVAVSTTSAWSSWRYVTIDIPESTMPPAVGALHVAPSTQVDGVTISASSTPTLLAHVNDATAATLRAEFELEHDPAAAEQGVGQIWTGNAETVASGTQASATVTAGVLSDGWKVRWRVRAIAGDRSSNWSSWQPFTVDVADPGQEPLALTSHPVIRTDQSFTVAAWVRWANKDGDYSIAEQRGVYQSPFRLGNTSDHGLVFTLTGEDAADAATSGVLSGVDPPVNEWFHLAGVYDAIAKTATLYLNGDSIKTEVITTSAWNAEAAMSLGTRMLGDLDDVQVYQQALNTNDMARLGSQASTMVQLSSQATPATTYSAAKSSQANAIFDVKYEHISLEDCIEAQRQAGAGPEQDILRSSLVVRPYSTCWSKYVYISEFHHGKRTGKLLGYGSAVQLKATWVAHSYLGTADGSGVVGDAGITIKPQQIKYFTRLSEIKTFGVIGVKYTSLEARAETTGLYDNEQLRLELNPVGEGGSTCALAKGSDRQATLGQWRSDGDDDFLLQMTDTDGDKVDTCTARPTLIDVDDKWTDEPVYLYDQIVFDEQGDILGRRIGGGEPWNTVYAPHFRCDWLTFGKPKVSASPSLLADDDLDKFVFTGACINKMASNVLVMSRSKNSNFVQAINHNADAMNPKVNGTTKPPLLDSSGKPIAKNIPGNWDVNWQNRRDNALRRSTDSKLADQHRSTFWKRITEVDPSTGKPVTYTNYCQYYFDRDYVSKGKECDEFPFASTEQGASKANGHYSVRPIDHQDNNDHGDYIKAFYRIYRVGNGNLFWIRVIN